MKKIDSVSVFMCNILIPISYQCITVISNYPMFKINPCVINPTHFSPNKKIDLYVPHWIMTVFLVFDLYFLCLKKEINISYPEM